MFFRTLLLWTLGLPVTLTLFAVVLGSLVFDRSGRAVHAIGALWCRIILALSGVRVSVTGAENIPAGTPVIFLSNHQGAFDIPALQANMPVQFRWVSKKSLFNIPVVGWSMTLAGYIPIDRGNNSTAVRSLLAAAKRVKSGTSVVIFPEGTRSKDGVLLPFKRGAFTLAARSGAPIVPVAINGTSRIMEKGRLSIRPADVSIGIGSPIPTSGVDEKELMNATREAIERLL